MDPILSPLVAQDAGAIGPDVANLQAVLVRLGFGADIPPEETAPQRLGEGTARAVARLFAMAGFGDNPTGAISDAAARKLNDFLVERRLLAVAEGGAADTEGRPAARDRIAVHDVQNLDGAAAAETTVDEGGHWRAFYDPRFYLEARLGVIQRTDAMVLVVRAFGPNGAEAARSAPTPNPDGRVHIDLVVQGEIALPPTEGARRVRGWLEDRSGARLAGFTVEVYDRDIGPLLPEQRLRTVTTDQGGAFSVSYDVADIAAGDAPPPIADLVFRVSDPAGGAIDTFQVLRQPVEGNPAVTVELPVPTAELPLGIPARNDELVRLVLAAAVAPAGPSEFETLLAAVRPLLGERSPAVMDEAATRDVSFATRETGQDAGKLGDLVAAFQLSEGAMQGVPPAALYALARTLELRDPTAIATRPVEGLAAALGDATPSLIPDSGQAPTALAANIRRIAAAAALAAPAAGAGTLAQVIAPHLPDPNDQAALVQTFADHTGSPPDFWRDWAAAHPDKPVGAIQLSLQLAAATTANATLSAAIQAAHPEAQSLRALTLQLDAPKVLAMMAGAPPPELEPDETPEAGAQRYAAGVAGLLDAAHPTAAVARLAKGWAVEQPEVVSPEAAGLMEQVVLHTDYELGSGGLAELADAQADVLFHGQNPALRSKALSDALRIERLYNVSEGPATLQLLTTATGPGGKPFKGAFDIGSLGKEAFLARFPGQPPETMTALSAIHETAQATAEASASLIMAALQEKLDPPISATKAKPDGRPIPSWAELFGTDLLTECEECRALNGPAAYLVQLFEFLDKRCAPNAAGVTPLDVLIGNQARGVAGVRPDLAHIKLSCENTDNTLPTIDLINEVLESCLVFGGPMPDAPNEPSPGVTPDELAAAPEHVRAKAYETLAQAVFPITLPYDLAAEARPYLEDAKTSREGVIELFGKGDADGLAAERLRLTPLDRAIIMGTAAEGLQTARVFDLESQGPDPEAGWAVRLDATLPAAAHLLGLSVADLQTLASTRFVSGAWPAADRALMARLTLDVATFKTLRDGGFAAPATDVQAVLDWLDVPLADLKAVSDRSAALMPRTVVADPPNAAKLADMRLVHLDGSPLAEVDWLRMHRLARLARRSGIAVPDLDLALTAISAPDPIDAAALQKLGALKALEEVLGLNWLSLAGVFGDFPPELYQRLFIRSGVARSDPAFQPGTDGAILAAPGQTIADHVAALAAAFELQVPEVLGLAEARGLAALDLASVAQLWRDARLASALGMAPGDLVLLQELTGQAPLRDPAAVLAFAAISQELKAVLAEALRFTGARAAPEDAAALGATKDALTAALAGVAADADRRRATLETLAQSLAIPADLLAAFIGEDASPDLARLQRLGLLAKTFSLKLPDVLMLLAAKVLPAVGADAKALMMAFGQVQAYVALRNGRQPAAMALALAALASPADAGWTDRVAQAIAACRPPRQGETEAAALSARTAIAVDVKSILDLLQPFPPGRSPQEDPISAFAAIDMRLRVAGATGASASSLKDLAGGGAAAGPALDALKRGTQARYEPTTWLQVARRLNDPLRQDRRDALVAHWKHLKGLTSDEALFSTLLMDGGYNPVVLTSRVANAINTTQLFVHSVKLGLWNNAPRPQAERVDPSQINLEWDDYLHSFRMTQANFEVLANPYFYMAPDLRDDKTAIFQRAESFLHQNEPTPENVQFTYVTFLQELAEVSNLEVCGTFLQEDFGPDEAFRFKSVLHVFGRSRGGVKRSYFYRRLNSYLNWQEWTPWEPIKVDIQAVERDRSTTRTEKSADLPLAGVHLLPVMWRRRLHIFWPSFVRKIQTSDETPRIDLKTGASMATGPDPYWEVKLCWSRLDNGVWSPRQMSSDYHETFAPIGVANA